MNLQLKRKIYLKNYVKKNRNKLLIKRRLYYHKNKFAIRIAEKIYYKNNIVRIKFRRRKYYKKNRAKILMKIRKYVKNRRKTNLNFKLLILLRNRLYNAVRRGQKSGSAVRDLGCSIVFLKKYVESKFYRKMTWDNYGKYWELDHIVPLYKFDLTKRSQFLKACNYKNLQPLTIEDHKKKTIKDIKIGDINGHK